MKIRPPLTPRLRRCDETSVRMPAATGRRTVNTMQNDNGNRLSRPYRSDLSSPASTSTGRATPAAPRPRGLKPAAPARLSFSWPLLLLGALTLLATASCTTAPPSLDRHIAETPHQSFHTLIALTVPPPASLPSQDVRLRHTAIAPTQPLPPLAQETDSAAGTAGPAASVLTLDDARRIAAASSPDVHAAHARLEAAFARIAEAQARYYPTLSLTHTSARTFHTPASRNRLSTLLNPSQPVPVDADLNTGSFALTTILNALRRPLFGFGNLKGNRNSFSEHSTALAASWLVFDGFVREARLLAARHLHEAAERSYFDVQRLVVRAVDSAYFQVQLAEERLRIARADESFSREQLEETRKLEAAGRATRADVDNFRVRRLAAAANVTAAIGQRDTGRVVLGELMGYDDSALPGDFVLPPLETETESKMTLPDVQNWIQRALRDRPDLAQQRALVKSENQNVRAAKGQFSPTVSLSGSWGYDHSGSMRYTVEDQSTAGAVDLRWDIYTGGSRRARLRAAESLRREAVANLHRMRLAVQSEVRTSIINLADAQERIRLQRENLETARENRRVIQAAYLAGKETLTRLNEAQRDYIEADANLALARIRLRQAWSDLEAAAAAYPLTGN